LDILVKKLCQVKELGVKMPFHAAEAAQQRKDKRLGGVKRLSDVAVSLRAAQGSSM